MEYIDNEIKRCEEGLRTECAERYSFLYCVQQALGWVLDPMSYASPVDIILNGKVGTKDIREDSADCLVVPRLPLSSNTYSRSGLPQQ